MQVGNNSIKSWQLVDVDGRITLSSAMDYLYVMNRIDVIFEFQISNKLCTVSCTCVFHINRNLRDNRYCEDHWCVMITVFCNKNISITLNSARLESKEFDRKINKFHLCHFRTVIAVNLPFS